MCEKKGTPATDTKPKLLPTLCVYTHMQQPAPGKSPELRWVRSFVCGQRREREGWTGRQYIDEGYCAPRARPWFISFILPGFGVIFSYVWLPTHSNRTRLNSVHVCVSSHSGVSAHVPLFERLCRYICMLPDTGLMMVRQGM